MGGGCGRVSGSQVGTDTTWPKLWKKKLEVIETLSACCDVVVKTGKFHRSRSRGTVTNKSQRDKVGVTPSRG